MCLVFLSLLLPKCFRNICFTSLKKQLRLTKTSVTITPLLVLAGKVFARGTRSQTSGLGRVWRRRCENHRSLGKFSAMLESQACGPVEKDGHFRHRNYTAKNPTGLLQVVNFTGLWQLVNKLVNFIKLQRVC